MMRSAAGFEKKPTTDELITLRAMAGPEFSLRDDNRGGKAILREPSECVTPDPRNGKCFRT